MGPLQMDDRDNPWRSLDRAPKDSTWVEVKVAISRPLDDKRTDERLLPSKVFIAHYACGGGEEQPPFIGWFEAVTRLDGSTSYFSGIPEPYAWRPLSQPEIKKVYV